MLALERKTKGIDAARNSDITQLKRLKIFGLFRNWRMYLPKFTQNKPEQAATRLKIITPKIAEGQ